MNCKAFGILLLAFLSPLVQAAPTGNASCDVNGCSGEIRFGPGSYFGFGGPSEDLFSAPISATYPQTETLADYGIGTNGGAFYFPVEGKFFLCDYSSQLNGVDCNAEVSIGSLAFPNYYDDPPGTLVTVKGPVSVGGDYCYPCNGSPYQNQFTVNGVGVFHYKVTAPQAYTLTSVDMTFGPTAPEPGTWALMSFGLAGAAAAVRRRRKYSRTNRDTPSMS